MKLEWHPTHGWHYVKSYPTKCRCCGKKVIYWECDCGSKCFFDPICKGNRQHECYSHEPYEHDTKLINLCYVCQKDQIPNLTRKGYKLIEIKMSACPLTKNKKSHHYYLYAK